MSKSCGYLWILLKLRRAFLEIRWSQIIVKILRNVGIRILKICWEKLAPSPKIMKKKIILKFRDASSILENITLS
jgi:hypothetical protein